MKSELTIIVAEDDDHDFEFLKETLVKNGLKNEIIRFENGVDLLDFLKKDIDEIHKDQMSNRVILLDIYMPMISGFEVLEEMQQDKLLRDIPVIVFTQSDRDEDLVRSYNMGIYSFLRKPVKDVDIDIIFKVFGRLLNPPTD